MTPTEPTATSEPSVSVHARIDPHGFPSVSITVHLPRPDAAARADELGWAGIREAVLAEVRKSPAVAKWKVLQLQLLEIETRIRDAEEAGRKAVTGRAFLEANPEPDMAAKVRKLEAEHAAAAERAEQARRDLDTLRGTMARHWCAAANAVRITASTRATRLMLGLSAPIAEAEAKLEEAAAGVEAVIAGAVRAHIAPAVAELLALRLARDPLLHAAEPLAAAVVEAACGAMPAGVRRCRDASGLFEVAPTPEPAPEAAPKPSGLPPMEHVALTTHTAHGRPDPYAIR